MNALKEELVHPLSKESTIRLLVHEMFPREKLVVAPQPRFAHMAQLEDDEGDLLGVAQPRRTDDQDLEADVGDDEEEGEVPLEGEVRSAKLT